MTNGRCLRDFSILAVLCFISFMVSLDVVDVDLMEARNFVTAREMVTEGHWLVPTMNGEIRLAKPPMPTWFAALSGKVAGSSDNLAALRFPSSLAACLMIFSTYGLSWAVYRHQRLAFLTAAMLATSVLIIDVGRTGTWDIFCHAFMVAALCALWIGLESKAGTGWPFGVAGIFLGLSFMSKGPVAFYAILLPFLLAYGNSFGLPTLKAHWRGLTLALALCLLLSLCWPLYILIKHADIAMLIVQKESDAWASRHVKPFWYYWHFLLFSGGWLILAAAALLRPYAAPRSANKRLHTFFLLWLAASLLLLSLIPEKKERYLLPAMIPLFFLTGDLAHGFIERFARNLDQGTDRALLVAHAALLSLLGLALPLGLGFFLIKRGQPMDWKLFAYGLACWSAAFFLIKFQRQRQVERLFYTTMAFLSLATLAVMQYYGVLTTENSEFKRVDSRTLAQDIGTAKVYLLGEPVDMRVIWDLGRRSYPWQEEEVRRLLEQGQPVAVLSKGEPLPLLPKHLHGVVLTRIVATFDYNKKRPDKRKIHLALLQAPGAGR